MSDSSDDMEIYSGFCDYDDDDIYEVIEKLEKIIYGLNIKINNLERTTRDIKK